MITRIVAGLVAIPLAIIPIYLGGVWCTLLVLAASLLATIEFYNLMDHGGFGPIRWFGLLWVTLFVISGWQPNYVSFSAVLVGGLLATMTLTLPRKQNPAGAWMSTSIVAIYLGIAGSQTLALRQLPLGLWWLLFAFVVTWATDTAAYFTGVTLGRNKLWPRLSPKKTWEGTIGGWIAAPIAAMIVASFSPIQQPMWLIAAFGVFCGILSLFGDLSISMLKRQMNVKDSGHFLPGHGGILDRLDSLLFVLPFVATIVLLYYT